MSSRFIPSPQLAVCLALCCMQAAPRAQGAVPAVRLDLKEAISLALRSELQPSLEHAKIQTQLAEASLTQARSLLGPQLDASATESMIRFDLRALGVDFPQVSPFVSNITLADVVGPFTLLDMRITGRKVLFDRGASGQVAAAVSRVKVAQFGETRAHEQIAAETARTYYAAVAAQCGEDAAKRGVEDAEFLLRFEEERNKRGLVSSAEVRRASLEVVSAQQRLAVARADRSAVLLELKAMLGVDFAPELELATALEFTRRAPSVELALDAALQSRSDLRNFELQARTLQLTERAIEAQKLPTVSAFGNIGGVSTAPTPSGSEPGSISYSYAAGVSVRVPILDGGRRAGQLAEVEARRHEAEAARRQLRRQVELGVRLTVTRLQAAEEQVLLAARQVSLADKDVDQAKSLFESGDASGVDLSEAQMRRSRVQSQYLNAVYKHVLARIALGEMTGTVLSFSW